MKEKIIELETAMLAKEKGFDWPTDEAMFIDDGFRITLVEGEEYCLPMDWNEDLTKRARNPDEVEPTVSLPTQALLQKWLREKHEMYLCVEYSLAEQDWFFYSYKKHIPCPAHFKTYEEALEAALIVGLEKI